MKERDDARLSLGGDAINAMAWDFIGTQELRGANDRWTALGYFMRFWWDCQRRADPFHSCCEGILDLVGPKAWRSSIDLSYVVADGKRHRFTGPDRDPRWLLDVGGGWRTYVIRRGAAGGVVKIGKTKHPRKRFETLQNGSAEQIRPLHVFIGDHEKYLHKSCASHWLRGEWFEGSAAFYAALGMAINGLKRDEEW